MSEKIDEILLECLKRIFSNWKALKIAVENRAGGVQSIEKAEWIPTAFMDWMVENTGLEKFEIEEFICDILNAEFNLIVDDGSLATVAQQVFSVYKIHQSGQLEGLEQACGQLPSVCSYFGGPIPGRSTDVASLPSSSEDEDSNEKLLEAFTGDGAGTSSGNASKSSNNMEVEVDEDGEVWQIVKTTKKNKNQ